MLWRNINSSFSVAQPLRETLLLSLWCRRAPHLSGPCFQFARVILFFSDVPWLVSVRHLLVHVSHLFAQCSDSYRICSGPLTISHRILRIRMACIHRERYQRCPARVTSVIQRIDTVTVVSELLVLQPCFAGLCVTCKDNTSKDPFSQCESLQGIRVQVKN